MKTIWIIARREYKAYFFSPIAYVYLFTFLVLSSWIFFRGFFVMSQAELRPFFSLMPWIFLFFVPAIAMGKWAEEKKSGTLEILLTLPVRNIDVVAAKFLASLLLVVTSILFTLPLPIIVSFLGEPDLGPVIGGYLGLILMGGAYLAICLFLSALTENQIIAFILGVIASFALLILGEPIVTSGLPYWFAGFLQYLGLGEHFQSIGRGVVDTRDIIYYLSVTGFFIWCNLKVIGTQRRPAKRDTAILAASILIGLLIVNVLASRHFWRVDLTDGKEFSLAPSTKNILKNLDDIVTVRVYFTKELPPSILQLKRALEDVLDEYKSYAGNKLRVEYHNPAESPEKEREVQILGIPPIQLNVIERDKREVAKVYLGLAVLFSDKKHVIPVVESPSNLEYELTTALLKVTSRETPKIAWVTSSSSDFYDAIKSRLEKRYVLSVVNPEKPENIDPQKQTALIVVNPKNMPKKMLSAIDQFLMGGGKVVALINTVDISNDLQVTPVDSGLKELFKHYGAYVDDGLVVDRRNTYAAFGSGYVTYQVSYPFWPMVNRGGFSSTNPIVSNLEALVLPWTSPIKLSEPLPEGVKAEVLAESSPESGVQPIDDIKLNPDTAQLSLNNIQKGVRPLAVLLTGGFKSFFNDKTAENASLLLVGNARFIEPEFLQQFTDDLFFFENAVDYLALGGQLIGIRTRVKTERPFKQISDASRITIKYAATFGAPVVVIGIGAMIFALRRRKRIWGQV